MNAALYLSEEQLNAVALFSRISVVASMSVDAPNPRGMVQRAAGATRWAAKDRV